ncbi:28624_t:CDS:1, partial [Dentiscutata erythropus]
MPEETEKTTLEEQISNTQPIIEDPVAINQMTPNFLLVSQSYHESNISSSEPSNIKNSEPNIPEHIRKLRGGFGCAIIC